MSTDTIFRQLGRLNESHTGIGPGKTREEYLKLFSRASYSTQNEWPYSSPFAGFYDVANTSTGLILLNQRYKFSHLRGKVLPKETARPIEDDYKTLYEAILESEEEQKSKHTHKLLLPRAPVDPYRHFESRFILIIRSCLLLVFFCFSFYTIQGQTKYWHNRMCKGSCSIDNTEDYTPDDINMTLRSRRPQTAGPSNIKRHRSLSNINRHRSISNSRRSKSALGTRDRIIDECQTDPTFAESLYQYYRYVIEKSQRPKLGLQHYHIKEPPSRRLRQSGIYRNPLLTRGQQLSLLEKCHIYDMEDSKTRHTNAYLQVLANRFTADLPAYKLDLRYRPEFRLNNPKDYFTYQKFLKTPRPTARPLNTGYFTSKQPHHPRIPDYNKKRQFNLRTNNYLDTKELSSSSFKNKKLAKDNSSHSSRRISASSFSTNHDNTVNIRFRQEPKQIPKIPVLSSQPHD